MSLDPAVQTLLEMMKMRGAPAFEDMGVDMARVASRALIALQGPQQQVHGTSDHRIPVEGGHIPARLYTPNANPHLPVVMFFHGGGFTIGDIDILDNVARQVCHASQCAVLSVGYRKGPEHPFPTAPEDAYAALTWLVGQAERLGVNANRLATLGDSAGGNLATVVCKMALDRGGPKVSYQYLIYPVVDAANPYPSMAENAEGYFLTVSTMMWFMGNYAKKPEDRQHPYLSPILHSLQGMPPATVVTAGYDPLRDQGSAYVEALRKQGVQAELLEFPGMIHGFFWMKGVIPNAQQLFDHLGQTLRKALAPT